MSRSHTRWHTVYNMDRTKKADIVVPSYSPEPYDILAIGIAAVAVFFVAKRAYRTGINEYNAALDRALSEIGTLGPLAKLALD